MTSLLRTEGPWIGMLFVASAWFTLMPMVQSEVVFDEGFRGRFAPWSDGVERPNTYPGYWSSLTQDDVFLSVYPAHARAREIARSGAFPLWDDRVLTGAPLLANGMVQPLSPYTWIAWLMPLWVGWGMMLFVQAFCCALGVYVFVRDRGGGPAGAVVAAIAMLYCPVFVWFLPYGSVVGGFAFVPLALVAARRGLRAFEQGRRRAGLRWVGALSACIALQLVATNLQFALYGFALQLVWMISMLWGLRRSKGWPVALRSSGYLLIGGLLGIWAASLQWMLVWEIIGVAGRDPSKYAGFNAVDPSLLMQFAVPRLLGDPSAGTYLGGWIVGLPPSSALVFTVGSMVAALGAVGAVACRGNAVAIGLVIVPVLSVVAASWPPFAQALGHLPGWNTLLASRALEVSYFGLAVLAAQGVDVVATKGRRAALAAAGTLLTASLIIWLWSAPGNAAAAVDIIAVGSTLVLMSCLIAMAWWRPRWAPLGVAVLVAVELLSIASMRLVTGAADDIYPPEPELESLAGRGRIVGLTQQGVFPPYHGDNLPPNTASMYGLEDVRGFVPLPTAAQSVVLANVADPSRPRHFLAAVHFANATSGFFDRAGVGWALAAGDHPGQGWTQASLGIGADARPWSGVYENTENLGRVRLASCLVHVADVAALVRHWDDPEGSPWTAYTLGSSRGRCTEGPLGSARLVESRPDHLIVDVVAAQPSFLIVGDTWYPGWTASINGVPAPLIKAEGVFRAVEISAGTHKVEMIYNPSSVLWGSGATFTGWAAILVLLVLPWRRSCWRPRDRVDT